MKPCIKENEALRKENAELKFRNERPELVVSGVSVAHLTSKSVPSRGFDQLRATIDGQSHDRFHGHSHFQPKDT